MKNKSLIIIIAHQDDEFCILWNDPSIDIDWPIDKPIVSEKDQGGITLQEFMK